jgi:hypothetical protein
VLSRQPPPQVPAPAEPAPGLAIWAWPDEPSVWHPTDPTTKTFTFWGWAIDPDTTDAVQIRLKIMNSSPFTDVTTTFVADEPRPDVATAYPGYGERHGFTVRVTLRRNDGICLWVTNVGPPADDAGLMCDVPLYAF